MRDIIWVGRHEGVLRDVARGCAWGNPPSLKQGARILSAFVPDGSVVVPMPSHIGYATSMLSLCKWVKSFGTRVRIWDGLKCDPHESSHIVKIRNGVPPDIRMYCRHEPPKGSVIIIDNTIATGATARAALDAMPDAKVLAITKG